MILRLSTKLNKKIKAGTLKPMPLDDNPYADWSCHLFTADRAQYILMTNTQSLYSCVMFGRGITDDSRFIERALSTIREFMDDDVRLPEAYCTNQRHGQFFQGIESLGHRFDERLGLPRTNVADGRRVVAARRWIQTERNANVGVGLQRSEGSVEEVGGMKR